jgi:magnesium-protoporphyrin IX monomethyl ester (oxidative) cyclase
MRANPKLLTGVNALWCRFFQLAVFATMYVRDHGRPEFHKALGMTPTEYDRQVFKITEEICRQVFPVTLDVDGPGFMEDMDRLWQISERMSDARRQGGIAGRLRRVGLSISAATTFAKLFFRRPRKHPLPSEIRLSPVW